MSGDDRSAQGLELPATGERQVTSEHDETAVEHLHRYALALPLVAGKTVLDIASGEGYGSALLSGRAARVFGVDISQEAARHAQRKYGSTVARFACGAAEKIPLRDGCIDVVVSFETIEHLDAHADMIAEIRRILRPGGVLLMSSPNRPQYSGSSKEHNPYHKKELDVEEFRRLLATSFKNVRMHFQRFVCASIVVGEESKGGTRIVSGDFHSIRESSERERCVFAIATASDGEAPALGEVSIFDGGEILRRSGTTIPELRIAHKELRRVRGSLSYRIGRLLTSPWRIFLALTGR